MRLVRLAHDSGARLGVEVDGSVADLQRWCADLDLPAPRTAVEALVDDRLAGALAGTPPPSCLVDEPRLLAPVDPPGKILALAANYAAHAEEVGEARREKASSIPHVFPKLPSTLVGPRDPISIPDVTDMVDYEVELAVVIGSVVDRVRVDHARAAVAGYVLFNDVSGRRMTFPERPEMPADDAPWDFLYGKWCNGFAIAGPWLVPARDIPDPESLGMRLSVNGVSRQQAKVGDYTYSIDEAISFISRICVLHPGDVITMGTPAGIGEMGLGCLAPGDVVVAEIDGLGTQVNQVRRMPAPDEGP